MTARPRRPVLAVALLAPVLLLACVAPTGVDGAAGPSLRGRWRYAATQHSPIDATVAGALVVGDQTAGRLAGTLDAVAHDPGGAARRQAGPLAGRLASTVAVDFDVQLDGAIRRHVGRLRTTAVGDSLVGSWVDVPREGGAPLAAGEWRAARE